LDFHVQGNIRLSRTCFSRFAGPQSALAGFSFEKQDLDNLQ